MSNLDALCMLVKQLETDGKDVGAAIAETELRLKMLRAIRATIDAASDPKPRARKEKVSE